MTLEPGTKATLTGMGGGPCEVTSDAARPGYARVLVLATQRRRTVPLSRLRITPEPTALGGDYTVTPPPWDTDGSITADMVGRMREQQEQQEQRVPFTLASPFRRTVRQREPRLESPQYLAYVRRHACCHCGAPGPSEPHHWSHHGGSTGAKCDDFRTVPLCQEHHRYWHDHGMLPGLDRVASEGLFVNTQRELLREWLDVGPSLRRPENVVDALVEAMRKMEAT